MSNSKRKRNKQSARQRRLNRRIDRLVFMGEFSRAKINRDGRKLFGHIHDPRNNPEAMKDIVEDSDSVYGFSPDPNSDRLCPYCKYDWSDPAFVEKAQKDRRAYHESITDMVDLLKRKISEGASIEETARAVSAERNMIRLANYDGDPDGLSKVKESNLATYGHEEGPTPDQLFEKYGSWQQVIRKSFSLNMGMDACCGLYDEYYQVYIEVGLVKPDRA